MALPPLLDGRLALPVIGSPMFIVSTPDLAIAQCTAGVVGSFPSLSARSGEIFGSWLVRMDAALAAWDAAHPERPAAPYAVNLIVHRTHDRLAADLDLCERHRVPIVITSLGARDDVFARIRAYGGLSLHDVTTDAFARKAIDKGADGLIAVAAGAGGHAGGWSPFALLGEIRRWFDGPLALSGAIGRGESILAAQAAGADLAYVGSAFIGTDEAHANDAYKRMVVGAGAADIVYTDFVTGVRGNYLRPSLVAAGLDPDRLAPGDPSRMDVGSAAKPWRDIWGCGQAPGGRGEVLPAAELIARLAAEYRAARARLEAASRAYD